MCRNNLDVLAFLGVIMDKNEGKKNLDKFSLELERYQNLSRTGLTRDEMLVMDRIIVRLKGQVKNLRTALYGH